MSGFTYPKSPALAPLLITPPADMPVSVPELKAHLRVDHDEEDELIDALGRAATEYLDGRSGVLGRALVAQTWRQDFPAFPCGAATFDCDGRLTNVLRLPLFPVLSIEEISYFDGSNDEQTLAEDSYRLLGDALGTAVALADGTTGWPTTACRVDAVSVAFVAGEGDPADVKERDKTIIRLLVGHWYEHREAVNIGNITSEIPLGVQALISAGRRISF